MKPHVTCRMASSVGGRTLLGHWSPDDAIGPGLFERIDRELGGDAWLAGRVTGEELARGTSYPASPHETSPRTTWIARRAGSYAVILDAHGRIDELSLIVAPAVDGALSSPSVFESCATQPSLAVQDLSLLSCQTLDAGAVWLRYRIVNRSAGSHDAA